MKIIAPTLNAALYNYKNGAFKNFLNVAVRRGAGAAISEYAARLCYQSVDMMGNSQRFVNKLVDSGHMSVFEHAVYGLETYDAYSLAVRFSYGNVLHATCMPKPIFFGSLRVLREVYEYYKESGDCDEALDYIMRSTFTSESPLAPESQEANGYLRFDGPIYSYDGDGWSVLPLCWTIDEITGYYHVTWLIEGISRACANQLVRHRTMSFSQESQRYVEANEPSYVVPPTIKEGTYDCQVFTSAMNKAWDIYDTLRRLGVKKEDARFVLPVAAKTKIIISGDKNALQHFFSLRTHKSAQWEIRALAVEMERQLGSIRGVK